MTGVSPAVVTVRCAAIVSGAAAAWLAYPNPIVFLIAIALAAFPGTTAPTVLMVGVAVTWLAEDGPHPATTALVRTTAVALALYYLHAASALAAVLPRNAEAAPGVYRRRLLRAGVITLVTIAASAIIATVQVLAGGARPGLSGWIAELVAGLALASGAVLYLARLARSS